MKEKLNEIVEKYKKVRTSGLNLKYFEGDFFKSFRDNFRQTSMFEEKKLIEEENLMQVVKNLQKIKKVDGKKTFTEVLEGKEGVKSVFNDFLKEKPTEMLSFGSSGSSMILLPTFMTQWHEKRIKEKLPLRVIFNNVPQSFNRIKNGPRLNYAQVRISPIKDFTMIGTVIYGETVNLIMFDIEEPLVIKMKGKQVSKLFKDNFEILWKHAKTLSQN